MEKVLLFITLIICQFSYGQEPQRLLVSLKHSCSYIEAPQSGDLYAFKSSDQALEIINQICKVDGIEPNFEVHAANVANAKAILDNGRRIILYSESFIQKINLASNTNWAGVSILAHEIGHHLDGHTLDENSTRPELELKADEFSGFILRKLGSSLEDAQIAVNTLCPNDGTAMYPPKSARLEAIAVGWNKGHETPTKDFVKFTNTLPRYAISTTFLDAVDHFFFTGTGSVHLELDNDKLIVSGQFKYKALSPSNHEYYADGSFYGMYYISSNSLPRKFPYSIEIEVHGLIRYGRTYNDVSIEHSCDFDRINLTINSVNDIQCSVKVSSASSLMPVQDIIFR